MPLSEYGQDRALRYLYHDGTVQAVLPMRTISDDGETYVGYTPAGTSIMYWALEDGNDPRSLPLTDRFRRTLTTKARTWEGRGVLRVIPRSEYFQVVHFWNDQGFAGWYVNLESKKTERGDFLDAVDWHLDLWIDPQREAHWKDIEEADAALAAGHVTSGQLDQAWVTGRRIADRLTQWPGEVGDWSSFAPPAEWSALALPQGWEVDR